MKRRANGTKERGRANGCGTLEKRGGIYRARWMVDGKTFTKSTGTGDRREAEAILAELVAPTRAKSEKERLENIQARITGVEAEIKRYEDGLPALRIEDAFEAYMKKPNVRAKKPDASTTSRYEAELSRLSKWLAKNYPEAVELRNVSKSVAEAFMAYLSDEVSGNTYNKYAAFLKRLWRVLDEDARLDGFNPWTQFDRAVEAKPERRELTPEELVKIGATVEGEMARLFAIGVYSGLRLGDAVRLDWGEVDLTRNHIKTEPRKTARYTKGREITIPLVPPFRKLLLSVPAADRTGKLCPSLAAVYERDPAALSKKIQATFRACGIETNTDTGKAALSRVVVGYHSFRHSFVTLAAEYGVPLAVVQAIVGHTSPAMTRRYTHIHETALQKELKAFPDVFTRSAGSLPAPDADASQAVIDAEYEELPDGLAEAVELDAATLAKLDALRGEGEGRADIIRRAVELLAARK